MSQSDLASIESSPRNSSLPLSYTELPSLRASTRVINGIEWLNIGHRPTRRRGIAPSLVWMHGCEYIKATDPDIAPSFICDRCNIVVNVPQNGATSNVVRHLRNHHGIAIPSSRGHRVAMDTDTNDSESPTLSSVGSRSVSPRPTEFRALYHSINIDTFRRALIELTVVRQLSFATITSSELQKLFLCLQPSLEKYLVTSP